MSDKQFYDASWEYPLPLKEDDTSYRHVQDRYIDVENLKVPGLQTYDKPKDRERMKQAEGFKGIDNAEIGTEKVKEEAQESGIKTSPGLTSTQWTVVIIVLVLAAGSIALYFQSQSKSRSNAYDAQSAYVQSTEAYSTIN